MPASALSKIDEQLADDMARFYDDPYGFVMYAFEWGEGELQGFDGPDEWQKQYLLDYGKEIKARNFDYINAVEAIRESTGSGHGIGKSALVAWLILFIMSTRPFCKGVVTANTGPQLESKTWAELAKWHRRCITKHWFNLNTSKGHMKISHVDHPEDWRCDAQTCREENSEAFAGLHAANSTPFYIFDEASAIPEKIWEVAEGGLTDGEPHFHAFGNPTRNTGTFHRNTYGSMRHRWHARQIDSRSVKITNKAQIQQWIDDYGEDSDFVRVRVLGRPPRQSATQFIDEGIVVQAQRDEVVPDPGAALVLGVDVARYGDDQTVLAPRRGLDGRSIPWQTYRGIDLMQTSAIVADFIETHAPQAVFIDGVGVGGGVVDRLRQMGYQAYDVNAGGSPKDKARYRNKRVEMWDNMKSWLQQGGRIPEGQELKDDFVGVEYSFDLSNRLQLERKEDMKRRGLASPDMADALSLTFSQQVARADMHHMQQRQIQAIGKFDLYE